MMARWSRAETVRNHSGTVAGNPPGQRLEIIFREDITMSSFVIEKREYVKAAGAVAGIASASHHFWVYDYRMNRNMTDGFEFPFFWI